MEKDELLILIEEYFKYLSSERNFANNTLKNYLINLNHFYGYLKAKNLNLNDLDYKALHSYFAFLANENKSKRTIARYYSAINSFFEFLIHSGKLNDNPLTLIDSPKYEKKVPSYLFDNQREALLNLNTNPSPLLDMRNKIIIRLLLDSGLRVSELVNIKLKDIDLNERVIKVFGKGSKERFVFFTKKSLEFIKAYLPLREEVSKVENLIINSKGESLSTRGVEKILKEIGKKIDIDLHPHMLRHTFASNILNNGGDLLLVKELLGHESIDTTQIYLHISNKQVEKKYNEAHPHSNKNLKNN